MTNDFLKLSLEFADQAGKLSLKYFDNSAPKLKKGNSVITISDQKISKLAQQYLKPFLKSGLHALIDEENPDSKFLLSQSALQKFPFIWSLDPIDGTRLYANQIPLYGISLGLFKNLKPYMSVVYFPVLKELFYCDGRKAYFVQNAFTKFEKKQVIKKISQQITNKSILFCDDAVLKNYTWESADCQLMIPSCAVVDLCWPTIGRSCGCIFQSSLWDMAGSWPIFQQAGLSLRSLSTGQKLDSLNIQAFETMQRPWKLKEFYVLSSEENYPIIKNKFKKIKDGSQRKN